MRQYQLKETKEITKIICNRCGKETKVVSGIPKREMLHVERRKKFFVWSIPGAIFLEKMEKAAVLICARRVLMKLQRGSSFQPNVKMNERVWFAVSGKP